MNTLAPFLRCWFCFSTFGNCLHNNHQNHFAQNHFAQIATAYPDCTSLTHTQKWDLWQMTNGNVDIHTGHASGMVFFYWQECFLALINTNVDSTEVTLGHILQNRYTPFSLVSLQLSTLILSASSLHRVITSCYKRSTHFLLHCYYQLYSLTQFLALLFKKGNTRICCFFSSSLQSLRPSVFAQLNWDSLVKWTLVMTWLSKSSRQTRALRE